MQQRNTIIAEMNERWIRSDKRYAKSHLQLREVSFNRPQLAFKLLCLPLLPRRRLIGGLNFRFESRHLILDVIQPRLQFVANLDLGILNEEQDTRISATRSCVTTQDSN